MYMYIYIYVYTVYMYIYIYIHSSTCICTNLYANVYCGFRCLVFESNQPRGKPMLAPFWSPVEGRSPSACKSHLYSPPAMFGLMISWDNWVYMIIYNHLIISR